MDGMPSSTNFELKVSHPVSNTCTKNDIDESVVDSQQDFYTQNNPIFTVEDTGNHRENSPNHSTCSSTISDVFPEEDQSNIQDIEQRSEGIANNTRTRLGSVESLRQIFEKKQESTETKGVSQTDTLATDFKEKLKMKVYFHVEDEYRDAVEIRNGMETKKLLSEKLRSAGNQILSYQVINLDTIICQNNCSGHGHCGKKNRNCICDAFWMENFLKTLILHDESNCDWSILYFVIVSFLIVVAITAIVWGFICWCKNRRCRFRWRTKKRHRYSLLKDSEYKDEIKLLPKGKYKHD
ncbi:Hypothetical predicted protein [Mytilus galloprovincialis]|uniref:Uncharacterized protein n=1 Tax=Mytilus galloprovincialis TaxID=29158 RepID=A0A8B6BDL1_MYTGA|nr:Hypothetical predicted protein [Mytilus galloprovincialis]